MAQGSIQKRTLDGGRIRWDVVVDLGNEPMTGKRRQRKRSFPTRKEAQAALNEWQTEISRGTAVDRTRQTVAEMLDFWLETYAHPNVRPVTYDLYARIIRTHIIPALGHIQAQKLT